MEAVVLHESDYRPALYGLGLSYGITSEVDPYGFLHDKSGTYEALLDRLIDIATKLAHKGDGHNEFMIHVHTEWLIRASRDWWDQMLQYRFADPFPTRMAISDLSESTMHTLSKNEILQTHFEHLIHPGYLKYLNKLRAKVENKETSIGVLKKALPEGYLQQRVVYMNYLCLRNVVEQRKHHKLPEWGIFCEAIKDGVTFPEWLNKDWSLV